MLMQYCFVVLFSNCSVYAAVKSAMVEGPGILNKEASVTYQNLSRPEKEQLRHQVEQVMSEEKRMTKKDVIRRGEKIFIKIQKLVHKITTNMCMSACDFKLETWSLLEHPEPFPTRCTGAPRIFSH